MARYGRRVTAKFYKKGNCTKTPVCNKVQKQVKRMSKVLDK